jgi:hypothetical protein
MLNLRFISLQISLPQAPPTVLDLSPAEIRTRPPLPVVKLLSTAVITTFAPFPTVEFPASKYKLPPCPLLLLPVAPDVPIYFKRNIIRAITPIHKNLKLMMTPIHKIASY